MTKKRIGLDLDHDGTMIPQATESAWIVADTYCFRERPDLLAENQRIRKKYLMLYEAGRLSRSDEVAWAQASVKLYRQGSVTLTHVREALKGVSYRPGLREHLEFLRELGVAIAITSWGIRQFIEILLANHGMLNLIDRVNATSLIIHDDIILGLDESTIVTPMNKGDFSRQFARDFTIPLEHLLAVTDSHRDHRIGHFAKNRLGVTDNRAELKKFLGHPKFGAAVHLQDGWFDLGAQWVHSRLLEIF